MRRRNVGLRFANATYAEYFHSLSSGVTPEFGAPRPEAAAGIMNSARSGMRVEGPAVRSFVIRAR
jgi:hypothetical protein